MSAAYPWFSVHLPVLLLLIPLTGSVLSFLAGPRHASRVATGAAILLQVPAHALAARVAAEGPITYAVGGWGAPLGIDLIVDGLSATLISLTALVGLGVTLYATSYFPKDTRRDDHSELFWPVWLLLLAALLALFSSGDVFNLYVCLELVSISAVILVGFGGGTEALRASLRYMFASMFASLLYLVGVALLYGAFGSLDIATLREIAKPNPTAAIAVGAMIGALALKTALFPMHFWLPAAHAAAPSPVSAALSALVVKGSFYMILRLVFDVAQPVQASAIPLVLGVMGAGAILWGSTQALAQSRLKMMVAYSTVAQIGYLFLIFPLATAPGDAPGVAAVAISGGVVHALAHGFAKAAMFLSAGTLLSRYGHDRIADLAGAARNAPLSVAAFALAGVTMMGLPPSGGFVAKWMLFDSSLRSGQWWWAVVLAVGGILAAAYVFRVVAVFVQAPQEHSPIPEKVGGAMLEWVPLTLALAAIALGFGAAWPLNLLGVGTLLTGAVR